MARQLELVDMPLRTPVRKRTRRDLVDRLRICGICHGRGAPKGVWDHDYAARILFWTWYRDRFGDWREMPFRLPNLVCHACKGSGLNASSERALELELGCRRQVSR